LPELAGVGGGDGGHAVGADDAGVQEVAAAAERQGRCELAGEPRPGDDVGRVGPALVLRVVDREDRGEAREAGRQVVGVAEQGAEQGGVPVVGVDHVGQEADPGGDRRDGPGEEGEASGVVRVPVEGLPLEGGVTDERVADRPELRRPDADALDAAVEGDVDVADPEGRRGGRQPGVPGVHDRDLVAGRRLGGGQGAEHVGEAARLGEGQGLGSGVEDAHGRQSTAWAPGRAPARRTGHGSHLAGHLYCAMIRLPKVLP
jgi:hypothetical protein